MRKKLLNRLDHKNLENLIAIALFLALGTFGSTYATASATSLEVTGAVPCHKPSAEEPIWGKLVVSGNTVTCYYAADVGVVGTPKAWTQIGKPQTINFVNSPVLVGIFISGEQKNALGYGTIDNFSITPKPSYQLADYDIGQPTLMGSANLINGEWKMCGGGSGVLGTSDQCNFQSWLVWGDCTVICRATSATGYFYQKLGIMVRDGFNSGSDCALFCIKNNGVDFQYRVNFKDNPDVTEFVAPPLPGTQSSVAVGLGLTGGTSYTLRP